MRATNQPAQPDHPTLSLFVVPGQPGVMTMSADQLTVPFRPNVVFVPPSTDELLYLLCCRNGVYEKDASGEPAYRISTSRGLTTIFWERYRRNTPLILNTRQASCSGKFLEMEMVSAAIIASHSYPQLSGCPLPFFLRSLIAELNINEQYVSQENFTVTGMPKTLERVTIGMLSPANATWQRGTDSVMFSRQHNTMLIANYTWSCDGDCNDGSFACKWYQKVAALSLEAKCNSGNVSTAQIVQTGRNTIATKKQFTIMVVTKFGSIAHDNVDFNAVAAEVNGAEIMGNAGASLPVASQLTWTYLRTPNNRNPCLVIIVLESIFYERYDSMREIYTS